MRFSTLLPALLLAALTVFGSMPASAQKNATPVLQSVVFIPTPADIVKVSSASYGVTAVNLPFLNQSFLDILANSHLGKPLSMERLDRIIAATREHAIAAGHPFVTVYLPEQKVVRGVVAIVVQEAVVSKVDISGAGWTNVEDLKNFISLRPGEPADLGTLVDDLGWLNAANAYRLVEGGFRPGRDPNSTELMLRVTEQKPWRVFLTRANSGTPDLNEQQYIGGITHGNFMGLGHEASLTHVRSTDGTSLKTTNASYRVPFSWRHIMTLTASYSKTDADILGVFNSEGRFKQLSARYMIPDYSPETSFIAEQSFGIGLDYKHSEGSVFSTLFGTPTGIESNLDVFNLVLGYKAKLRDRFEGTTDFYSGVTFSPGRLSGRNDDAAFEQARIDTDATYAYLDVSIDRVMPFEIAGNTCQLKTRFAGKVAGDRLAGSERLVLGGLGTLRGYHNAAFSGDYGYSATVQVDAPPLSIIKADGVHDALVFSVFTDVGMAANIRPDSGAEDRTTGLASVGVGARYQLNRHMSLTADYAYDLTSQAKDDRQEVLFSLTLGY